MRTLEGHRTHSERRRAAPPSEHMFPSSMCTKNGVGSSATDRRNNRSPSPSRASRRKSPREIPDRGLLPEWGRMRRCREKPSDFPITQQTIDWYTSLKGGLPKGLPGFGETVAGIPLTPKEELEEVRELANRFGLQMKLLGESVARSVDRRGVFLSFDCVLSCHRTAAYSSAFYGVGPG